MYRCTDSTGCCKHVTDTCGPVDSETQEIDVIFMVTSRSRRRPNGQTLVPEVIKMANHTRCECKPLDVQSRASLGDHATSVTHSRAPLFALSSITLFLMI